MRGRVHLFRTAQEREEESREESGILHPVDHRVPRKPIVDPRRALTWEAAGGRNTLKARLVAKSLRGPGSHNSVVKTAGWAILRSSDLQLITLRARKKW